MMIVKLQMTSDWLQNHYLYAYAALIVYDRQARIMVKALRNFPDLTTLPDRIQTAHCQQL
jgi:hypothetical protein